MKPLVAVDWSPESPLRFRDPGWTVVVVDVIRASTTAVTAVSAGHRCFPAASLEHARDLAARLPDPVLAGEIEGKVPPGFDMQNSPAAVAELRGRPRDIVLLSTSGTRMMTNAAQCESAYVACLRNLRAQVSRLIDEGRNVAVLGAGSGGTFRPEDRVCCALIAQGLVEAGHLPYRDTGAFLDRHAGVAPDDFSESDSVAYLRRTDQMADLRFIVSHVDDVDAVFAVEGRQVISSPGSVPRAARRTG